MATIVAYIICSLFWKSTSAAYESLDSNTEDEEEVTTSQKQKFLFQKIVLMSGCEQSEDVRVNCCQSRRRRVHAENRVGGELC